MIPKEVLKKVKHIEIQTKRLVNDLFGGEYHSVFKGQGIEFADVREYVAGDEIRSIDWNVTARSQQAFVKKFVEERELTVFFMVDMSGSQFFGTGEKLKSEVAAEIAALLSFSAVKNNDKVGLLICTDQVEKAIPVQKGNKHVLRVVREILYYKPERRGTNLQVALEYLNRVLTRTAVVFLISDFRDQGYEKALKVLNRRHDVIAIHLKDDRETELPSAGLMEFEDRETGRTVLVDTSSRGFRRRYSEKERERHAALEKLLKQLRIDKIEINSKDSYADPILKFFLERDKRKSR